MDIAKFNPDHYLFADVCGQNLIYKDKAVVLCAGFAHSREQFNEYIKFYQADKNVKDEVDFYLISRYALHRSDEIKAQDINYALINAQHIDKVERSLALLDTDIVNLQKILKNYQHIDFIGWSFGIRALCHMYERLNLPKIKLCAYALCGSILAVDEQYGIAPRMYLRTLRKYSKSVQENFYHSIFPQEHIPQYISYSGDIEEQKAELSLLPFLRVNDIQKCASIFKEVKINTLDSIMPSKSLIAFCEHYNIAYTLGADTHMSKRIFLQDIFHNVTY